MRRRVADDSPFKKVDLKNAFANYALHFSLSAFYFVVGCQRDFLFGLVKVRKFQNEFIKSSFLPKYEPHQGLS